MDPALLAAANFVSFDGGAKRKRPESKKKDDDDSDSEDDDESSEDSGPKRRKDQSLSWSNPPDAVRCRQDAKDMTAGQYVEHFVRFAIGKWEAELLSGKKIEGTEKNRLAPEAITVFCSKNWLQQTKDAMMPLIARCRKSEVAAPTKDKKSFLNSMNKDKICHNCKRKGHILEDCTAYGGGAYKEKAPEKILDFLEKIASLAAGKEYAAAVDVYVEMMQKRSQQKLKLYGGKIQKAIPGQNFLNTTAGAEIDKDPEETAFCQNFKRLVQFIQYLAPNPELEKNSF